MVNYSCWITNWVTFIVLKATKFLSLVALQGNNIIIELCIKNVLGNYFFNV